MAGLVISAKDLSVLAKEPVCGRCFWTSRHVKPLPYQRFPGIFSSIDRYNKRIVDGYFAREGRLPSWLQSLGQVTECIVPPHFTRFSVRDPATGVTLRGEADGIFRLADGSCAIVDYKTDRYTEGQDSMLPLYRAQLNSYAYIAERTGLGPVSKLALVYMEPLTDQGTASSERMVDGEGFILGLKAMVVPVTLHAEGLIPGLLRRASEIWSSPVPVEGAPRCRDCAALQRLLEAHR
jgi:hypothetical protein